MMILKCKMCGGDVEASLEATYGTCDSCGNTITLPKISDERRVNLFNRANHFRQLNDFDKAINAYENILEEDDANAEAHWGVVLSRYGIEYVEDPKTGERIPTCHRVQATSLLSEPDYLAALEYSPDDYTRSLYEQEARRISKIQKDILAISSREEPYDIFICYKETTNGGTRTKDSTIAQDIYYQLQSEGYKVFFSRVSLEDKLGQEYEPYIFAALKSAKVMVVVSTSLENINSVWVKNEWSRYLDLMKSDRDKLLIPCYRDMDPYDLPDALSILQSQDISKIGFMQDLLHGINKVLNVTPTSQKLANDAMYGAMNNVPQITPLLKRAALFLEDSDFASADAYYERVLDMDPECGAAYWGKLMVAIHVNDESQIATRYKIAFHEYAIKSKLVTRRAYITPSAEQTQWLERARHEAIYDIEDFTDVDKPLLKSIIDEPEKYIQFKDTVSVHMDNLNQSKRLMNAEIEKMLSIGIPPEDIAEIANSFLSEEHEDAYEGEYEDDFEYEDEYEDEDEYDEDEFIIQYTGNPFLSAQDFAFVDEFQFTYFSHSATLEQTRDRFVQGNSIQNYPLYSKALRFAAASDKKRYIDIANEIDGYIHTRIEEAALVDIARRALLAALYKEHIDEGITHLKDLQYTRMMHLYEIVTLAASSGAPGMIDMVEMSKRHRDIKALASLYEEVEKLENDAQGDYDSQYFDELDRLHEEIIKYDYLDQGLSNLQQVLLLRKNRAREETEKEINDNKTMTILMVAMITLFLLGLILSIGRN